MTTQSLGLVGHTNRLIHKAAELFESSLVRIFVWCVVGAALLSLVEHLYSRNIGGIGFWKLLLLGLGAILAELMGIHRMILAWHKAQPATMIAWGMVWCLGFAFALYNAVGSASETQVKRTNLQQAAFTSHADARADLEAARARVKMEEKNLAEAQALANGPLPTINGQPVMSVSAAQAMIEAAEGNTRFWNLTSGCTDAKGPQARAFCATYAEAKKAKGDLEGRQDMQKQVAHIEQQVADARTALRTAIEKANHTEVVTTQHTPFVAMVSFATGYQPEQVAWVEPFQVSVTNMLLVSLAGAVMALTAIQGIPRTRWINWGGIHGTLFGGEAQVAAAPTVPAPDKPEATPLVPITDKGPASVAVNVLDDATARAIIQACRGLRQQAA